MRFRRLRDRIGERGAQRHKVELLDFSSCRDQAGEFIGQRRFRVVRPPKPKGDPTVRHAKQGADGRGRKVGAGRNPHIT
jgi:hypothetical protein